jgi:hypothetical protein
MPCFLAYRRQQSSNALTVAVALALAIVPTVLVAQDDHRRPYSVPSIPTPQMRGATAPTPPPNVPHGGDAVPAMTLEIAVQRGSAGPGHQVTQRVTRNAERVHLSAEKEREWLFERNPVDRRRVGAFLVDHPSRAIITYGESDVRMLLGIRGWADILSLGFDAQRLASYQRTDEQTSVGTIRFTRYVQRGTGRSAGDVWWSDAHLIAREFVTSEPNGETRFTVANARPGVDPALLEWPHVRFPDYRVINVADWLEHP